MVLASTKQSVFSLMTLYKKILCTVCLASAAHTALAKDVGTDTREDTSDRQAAAVREKISFFDSKVFDATLARELEQGKDAVEIDVTGRVPINSIPPRIDRWIAKSAEEGKVEIKPHVASRSWFSVVPMIFNAFGVLKNYQEEKALGYAKGYDTVIYYKTDEHGEALINKIVMTKRK